MLRMSYAAYKLYVNMPIIGETMKTFINTRKHWWSINEKLLKIPYHINYTPNTL